MTPSSTMRRRIPAAVTVALAVLAAVAGKSAAPALVSKGFGRTHGRSQLRATSFKIAGDLPGPALPGATHALDLRVTNPHRYGLWVKDVRIEIFVDPMHAKAGCDRRANFRATPLTTHRFRLPPRRTTTLRQAGVRALPTVQMLDLPRQQDACQGAKLTLRYSGRAERRASR